MSDRALLVELLDEIESDNGWTDVLKKAEEIRTRMAASHSIRTEEEIREKLEHYKEINVCEKGFWALDKPIEILKWVLKEAKKDGN